VPLTAVPLTAVLLTALGCAAAALLTSGRLRRVSGSGSRWVATPGFVLLAGAGGAAAAVGADGVLELAAYAVLAVTLAALVLVDLAVLRLPDRILGPASLAFFALLTLAALGSGEWSRLGRALLAALVLLVGYCMLAVARPAGLGLGDVKLAGLLGGFLGWLGWSETLMGTLAAFAVGGLCTALLLVTGRVGRGGELPFGPSMVVGALVGALSAGALLA
jgi:leader peptidase (prepilin peptidase)/N-methyltransferase